MSTSSKNQTFRNPRVLILLVIAVAIFGVFVLRLWDVQIANGAYYRDKAINNSLQLQTIDAPRGIIYDRNGIPLVHNGPSFEIQIVPAYLPDGKEAETKVFQRLAELLNMQVESQPVQASVVLPMGRGAISMIEGMHFMIDRLTEKIDVMDKGIKNIVDQVRNLQPYSPVTIKAGVDREVAMHVAEEAATLPGVRVNAASAREYISGTVTSQILGYLRRISQDDLATLPPNVYDSSTDRIGAVGIEGQFEDVLRGQKGQRAVEEDVVGREIRVVGQTVPAVPGDSVYLTLDFDLQKVTQQALQDEITYLNNYAGHTVTQLGAAIALNPKTGEILAMVSLPTYDNNIFSQPFIKTADLKAITDDPYLPQINHAFQSAFPPGSTFKIVLASGALQEGVLTPRTTIFDPGFISIPDQYFPDDPRRAQKFVCWLPTGHGDENVVQALAHSCDVFFYEVGGGYHVKGQPEFNGLGIDQLKKYAQLFGYGASTGIDLIGEAPGFVPDPVWKRRNRGENWTLGDTYNMAIGQGFLTATPLQVVDMMAALANNGVLMKPHIVSKITTADGVVVKTVSPEVLQKIPVTLPNLQLVQEGVKGAVAMEDGTAIKVRIPGVSIAAKTGTAEYCDDIAIKNGDCYPGHQPSHAWFTAYAPAENPQIAVVVFIYNGGEGSANALPVAQKMLQYWFEQHPVTSTVTGQ